ncbi:amino acid adenylation domain-containing protein [Chryseolinea sp. Jin1]|uniref:Amino acid adenylation domain-containing protein n=2 Tax=Chryseolinea lacunae TaxID=2801331 RepID=A0ABS1KUI5_9BACT|nr:non-ribosomal peptide synthetase [Chryseolinea lacunae]MBL0743079.1 amino acid adenylation domain-containing protein [Chryseolinea lacunae]
MQTRFRLSPEQRRQWVIRDRFHFYQQCVVQLTGPLNTGALIESIGRVVRRHEGLRTKYVTLPEFSFPLQEVQAGVAFDTVINSDADKKQAASNQPSVPVGFPAHSPEKNFPLYIELTRHSHSDHALTITLPASAADSTSVINIVREISAVYGQDTLLNDAEIAQYGHFSEWQNELVALPEDDATEFWKKYDYQRGNENLLSFHRKPDPSKKLLYSVKTLKVGQALGDHLKRVAHMAQADLSRTMLACLAVLLRNHIGSNTFTIGFVNTERNYEELKPVVGLLSKTLPVIVEVDPELTFSNFVGKLVQAVESVVALEDYFAWPDERPQTSDTPYFKIGFEYLSVAGTTVTQNDVQFSIVDLKSLNDIFDLKVSCLDLGDTLQVDFEYNSEMLTDEAITVLMAQLETLFVAVSDGDQRVKDIDIRGKTEIGKILSKFSQSAQTIPFSKTVVALFEETVARYANAAAVEFGDEVLSYQTLNARANQVARALQTVHGVAPGSTVALRVARSEKMIVLLLGILKAGAVYVPIDVNVPEERVRFILEDCSAKALITDNVLDGLQVPQLSYEHFSSPLHDEKNDPALARNCADPVYIIYTSGSTGNPKGVIVAHTSLVNYVDWFASENKISAGARTLLLSSIAFDLCYTSLWTSLLTGGTLCVLPEMKYLESAVLAERLVRHRIDYIKLTPSHFSILINDPYFETNVARYNLSLIVLGGEVLQVDDLEKYFQHRSDVVFLHHYGPTEATIGTIAERVTHAAFNAFKRKVVLGRPITNNAIYILDETGSPCAIGCSGELCVAGRGLALGYLNRDELMQAVFVNNPFDAGAMLYKTGDYGRWMPDGKIEFLGRRDNQVKIRGYRIEVGEIEETFKKHDGVKHAVVLADKDENKEWQLTGYVVADAPVDITALQNFLKRQLPGYMIPAAVVQVDAMPLTANGKVDRKLLLAKRDAMADETTYVAPRTPLEGDMAAIWQRVLQKERVGIDDDFFRLGGHSLKATQLVSKIFKELGFKIKLADVFENPTIKQLMLVIVPDSQADYTPIDKVAEAEYYEVSHAQKRLWFIHQFDDMQNAYNIHSASWIKGALDVCALERAFETLQHRHESLRTTFVSVDGQPKQKISKTCTLKISFLDLSDMPDPEAIACDMAKDEANVIFSLENGPLMNVKILRVSDTLHAFMLTMHHIVSDGWSMQVLMNELIELYSAYGRGQENPLEPLKIQYKDYSGWHKHMVADEERYWLSKLANLPELVNLPHDAVTRSEQSTEDIYRKVTLTEETSTALRRFANTNQTTVSNVMLTVYTLFINKISGQDDFLIGVGHANRNHPDVENLIGFFVNILAIRVQFSNDTTIESALRQVSLHSLEALEHSNYPFNLLVEKLCKERYSSRQPLLNVMYDYKNYNALLTPADHKNDDALLEVSPMPALRNPSKFDLTLFVSETADDIAFYFEHNDERIGDETIHYFYGVFHELIHYVVHAEAVVASEQLADTTVFN